MGVFTHKFSSAKQEWETPQDLFDKLHTHYQFTFDLAADSANAKCENYFTEQDNALTKEWKGTCWLNPPYGSTTSKLKHWVIKAYQESQKGTCRVVMLIPARTNTTWFRDYCMKAEEVLFICGRPKFGDAPHGLPQPLMLVVFGPTNSTSKVSIWDMQCLKAGRPILHLFESL